MENFVIKEGTMNWLAYFIIALIIMIISLICYIVKDIEYLDIFVLIQDVAEAALISVGWAITIPILAIANILTIILLILFGVEDNEE